MRKLFGVLLLSAAAAAASAAEVNVYSARKEALILPLLERFTEKTGITVNLLTAEADALLKRLESEGHNTPADVLITVDAGRLHRAKAAGVLQPVRSQVLEEAIPAAYRDPEGYWYGLSLRARVIFYAKDRVRPEALSTYEDLADPRWRGRICVRSSSNIYNQSLVASLIAAHGEAEVERWARGLVANFARPPRGGDRDQIKAVAAGECDLALANTYYYAQMLTGKDAAQREAARKVGIFFPNQDGRGAHVNVSGAGVTRWARHREEAVRLLEFLASEEAQAWYAEVNHEYPVRPGVPVSEVLQAWGDFRKDSLNLARLGELNAAAVRIMDRAGWR
ncbi:Fe(3+) ABC transporter substrate-binding protein [Inmirania thermothiophila]|uniref:Iron(III) transport system substrate-binding protein n=1 Tax=Inmirania thermothiophila TaxID=1750597 RepID=A0A3N1Y749_9GAMM|nr:Fe(3+) ABC transporter substrate-binding protein [Inmirania thermothiophila]ROR34636.1 iron(III) transport system substrate-binding protein [Inmirania thermothiophila]